MNEHQFIRLIILSKSMVTVEIYLNFEAIMGFNVISSSSFDPFVHSYKFSLILMFFRVRDMIGGERDLHIQNPTLL